MHVLQDNEAGTCTRCKLQGTGYVSESHCKTGTCQSPSDEDKSGTQSGVVLTLGLSGQAGFVRSSL
jgi:hypothetical protein